MREPIRFLIPSLPPLEEVEAYFAMARDARRYSNFGPCHELLVERVSRFLGGVACVPVANCTLGLMVALRAAAGEPHESRREVVVPSFTFAATVAAIRWCGFDPVFVDVDPVTWHADPEAVADAVEQGAHRTAALVLCSTFGTPPPGDLVRQWELIAARAGVPLVVDTAAGFGAAREDGVKAGAAGDVEAFSFHATKPLAIGEGGVVTTKNPDLAEAMRKLINFGFGADRIVDGTVGLNAKLDEWHAAVALAALDRLPDVLARRQDAAARYRVALEPRGFSFQEGSVYSSWQFLPALAPDPATRAALIRAADADFIEIRTYFDPPLHEMPAFSRYPRVGELRATESLASRMVSLPFASDWSDTQLGRVVAAVDAAIASLATP